MKTTIIIPTYNERENIGALIPALFALNIPNLRILVVDDSSPDGTGDVVRAHRSRDERVFLLTRPKKQGLGRAYAAGFRHALAEGTDAVVQMDADFSHRPEDVVPLLTALETHDLAIGSRYIPRGGVSDWSPQRQRLSRTANQYARLVTGAPIHDLTGGFTAIRSAFLRHLDVGTIGADGYGFQIALKVRAWKRGASLTEVPIVFVGRKSGTSKLDHAIMLEAAWLVWALRWEHRRAWNTRRATP